MLVANAGIAKFAPLDDYPEALFDEVSDINFKGAFFTVASSCNSMRGQLMFRLKAFVETGRANPQWTE